MGKQNNKVNNRKRAREEEDVEEIIANYSDESDEEIQNHDIANEVKKDSKKKSKSKKQKKNKKQKLEADSEDEEEAAEEGNTVATKPHQKKKTLVFSSRNITSRYRHLMQDVRSLLPHSKPEVKFDGKQGLKEINWLCEMKSCNSCIYFECRKRQDLYLWVSGNIPNGPSAKFLLRNVHTLSELKLTGNCLKFSRPLLHFDANFDTEPHLQVMKELFTQVFSTPKGHHKSKPFIDHVFSFFYSDNKVWFRHYQIVDKPKDAKNKDFERSLVEIGPRFVLDPVRVFDGSFSGKTLYENPRFISPNYIRQLQKRRAGSKYSKRVESKEKREEYLQENQLPEDFHTVNTVFKQ